MDKQNAFDPNRQKIRIVLGGSFNPPTRAHEALMLHAMRHVEDGTGQMSVGMFVPSSHEYVKRKMEKSKEPDMILFSEPERMELLEAYNNPLFEVSDTEYGDDGKGHTYRTLCRLRDKYPDDRIMFLAGADKLKIIPRWHDAEKLLSEFTILMTCRNEADAEKMIKSDPFLSEHVGSFWLIPELPKKYARISSTAARRAIADCDYDKAVSVCGYDLMKLAEKFYLRIFAESHGRTMTTETKERRLKKALMAAGPDAVSRFVGQDAGCVPFSEISSLIDDTMAQMPEEELTKFETAYLK